MVDDGIIPNPKAKLGQFVVCKKARSDHYEIWQTQINEAYFSNGKWFYEVRDRKGLTITLGDLEIVTTL